MAPSKAAGSADRRGNSCRQPHPEETEADEGAGNGDADRGPGGRRGCTGRRAPRGSAGRSEHPGPGRVPAPGSVSPTVGREGAANRPAAPRVTEGT